MPARILEAKITPVLFGEEDEYHKIQVYVRVYFPDQQKTVYRATGAWCRKPDWGEGFVTSRERDYMKANELIRKALSVYENMKEEHRLTGKVFNPNSIRYAIDKKLTFNDFCRKASIKGGIRASTYVDRMGFVRILEKFGTVYMSDLDTFTLDRFNDFINKKGFAVNTIWKFNKHFKAFINQAIAAGYLQKNPYFKYKVKRITKNKFALTDEQVAAIRELPQSKARDMFLISCATGLRYSDVSTLNESNIKYIDGKMFIIIGEMKKIANRGIKCEVDRWYVVSDLIEYNFPGLFKKVSNVEVNILLKSIEKYANLELESPLTFHVSRHTFLTKTARETGNVWSVMKAGGITSTATAQGYVDMNMIT
jgi:integrase